MSAKVKVVVGILVVFFVAGNISAQGDVYIISGETGLASGWTFTGPKFWGTITTENREIVKKGTSLSFLIDIHPETGKVYSGSSFFDKDSKGFSNAIMLKKSYLENGVLNFYINGGKNVSGNFQGGQKIQICFEFLKRDNTKYTPKDKSGKNPNCIRIDKYLEGEIIDNNPDTWQKVLIPLELFFDELCPPLEEIVGIANISFQFAGNEKPQSGIYITEVMISLGK
ncbi:MAG: hypothetical protein AABY84_05060 [Candidatus Firestonebacteria bacterium]